MSVVDFDWMLSRGMYREMEGRTGVSYRTFERIATVDGYRPTVDSVDRIAIAFGVTYDEMCSRLGIEVEPVYEEVSLRKLGGDTCDAPSRGRYNGGCRCFGCRQANAEYEYQRTHGRAKSMVGERSVARCRRHVRHLLENGWTKRSVCRVSGVSRSSLRYLLEGHTNSPDGRIHSMSRKSYGRLMALRADDHARLPGASVIPIDGELLSRRLKRLHDGYGVGYQTIADAAGLNYSTVYRLTNCPSETILAGTVRKLVPVIMELEARHVPH